MSRTRIRIHAPPEGCAPFTSSRRAAYFIRRGQARMVGDELHFHGPPAFFQRLESAEFEQAVREGRGDRVYWNGSAGHHKAKKPGLVRS
jgi:hypothetical protein